MRTLTNGGLVVTYFIFSYLPIPQAFMKHQNCVFETFGIQQGISDIYSSCCLQNERTDCVPACDISLTKAVVNRLMGEDNVLI